MDHISAGEGHRKVRHFRNTNAIVLLSGKKYASSYRVDVLSMVQMGNEKYHSHYFTETQSNANLSLAI